MPKKVKKPKKLRKTNKTSKAKKPAKVKKQKKEKIIGKVEHYFDKIRVVTTTLKNPLKVGDIIHVKGHTTDFIQNINSIQIEHETVQKAKKGNGIGIKVNEFVRDHDIIYLADKKTIEQFQNKAKPSLPILQQPIKKPVTAHPKFLSF